MTSKSIIVGLLFFLVTVAQMSGAIYSPALPEIASSLHATDAQVQLTMSIFMFSFALFPPIYGPLSDRIGRRKIVLFGMVCFLGGTYVCAHAQTIEQLWAGRLIQGAGISSVSIIARTVVADLFSGDAMHSAISTIIVSRSVTPLVAPFLGGILQHYFGWRADFLFLLGYGAMCLAMIYLMLPETNMRIGRAREGVDSSITAVKNMLKSIKFMSYVMCFASLLATEMVYLMVAPFLIQNRLGWSVLAYSRLPIFTVICYLLGTRLAVYFKRKALHDQQIMCVGCVCAILGSLSMLAFRFWVPMSVSVIVGPMMLLITGLGLCMGICNAQALNMFRDNTGVVSAVIGSTSMLVCTVTTSLVAYLHLQDQGPLAIVLLVLSMVAVTATALIWRAER